MKKLSNVSEVVMMQLKNDIHMLSVRIFQAKEEHEDIGSEELHSLSEQLHDLIDTIDNWANQKD